VAEVELAYKAVCQAGIEKLREMIEADLADGKIPQRGSSALLAQSGGLEAREMLSFTG
jgi:hypothetical protein